MAPDRNNIMQEIVKILNEVSALMADAQRARTMDELMKEKLLPMVDKIANAPVWNTLKDMVTDAAIQMLEEDTFSPSEAAKPAHHVLQALDTIHRGGAELKRWAADDRFKLPKESKAPTAVFKKWLSPPSQPARLPVAEIVEQLAYLMGLLGMAGREAHLASNLIIRVRDLRARIAPGYMPSELPHIEVPGYLIPLPTSQYLSQGDKGRDLLLCLERFGEFLIFASDRGRERIRSASVDDTAFSPAVVAAEAMALSTIVTNGMATCDALAVLAWQFIGDIVSVEYEG